MAVKLNSGLYDTVKCLKVWSSSLEDLNLPALDGPTVSAPLNCLLNASRSVLKLHQTFYLFIFFVQKTLNQSSDQTDTNTCTIAFKMYITAPKCLDLHDLCFIFFYARVAHLFITYNFILMWEAKQDIIRNLAQNHLKRFQCNAFLMLLSCVCCQGSSNSIGHELSSSCNTFFFLSRRQSSWVETRTRTIESTQFQTLNLCLLDLTLLIPLVVWTERTGWHRLSTRGSSNLMLLLSP